MSAIDLSGSLPVASTRQDDSTGLPIDKNPDHPRTDSNVTSVANSHLAPNIKPGRRRDKPQLSCNHCRARKSRCDRKQPCSNCSSRGQTCAYAPGKHGYPSAFPSGPSSTSGTLGVQGRLVQLERLVMSLIPTAAANRLTESRDAEPQDDADQSPCPLELMVPNHTPPEVVTPVDGFSDSGSIGVTAGCDLHYVVSEHWSAILDNIADLKDHFNREGQLTDSEDPHESQNMGGDLNPRPPSPPGRALLLYPIHRSSRVEILASLPPKGAVDRYLSYYFNHLDHASSVVHGPTFLKQCDEFWNDPSSTPINWVALLYSMLSLSARALALMGPGGDVDGNTHLADFYHEKVVQCLILGDYTNAGPYVLETMVQYAYIEFGKHLDSGKDIWFLLGLAITLAMRMGYHRDPSHFPNISPLEGEIRRRTWVTVLQGDVLISNQMGMPRMLTDSRCDTAEPRNLHDSDFDGTMTELPPSRPETEYTRALGLIGRRRILVPLGGIADLMTAASPCTYSDVMRFDEMLNKAADSVPPPLKMKPMAASVTDSPIVIIDRLFIRHMLCKGRTMLHRRYLHAKSPCAKTDLYAYSRKACVDASLASLEIQRIYDEETCPGGQLSLLRWGLSSIQNHQSLTATMILCSVLYHRTTSNRTEEIRAALRKSREIWGRSSSRSREAMKAAGIISIVLARTGDGNGNAEQDIGARDDHHCGDQGGSSNPNSHPGGVEGSDTAPVIDFDENKVIQCGMGYDESNHFSYSVIPNTFSLDAHPLAFDVDNGGTTNGLDDWVANMEDLGTDWNVQ